MISIITSCSTNDAFMWAFKKVSSFSSTQGNIGEWGTTISEVDLIGKEMIEVPGYPEAEVFLYEKKDGVEKKPLIVFIHGGGWCIGNAVGIEWYAKLLASNGYIVANVDYSLAPEYKYPVSTIQLVESVNYLYENSEKYGYDRDSIFIGGNSAGAHLASQLGAIFTNEEYAKKVGAETRVPKESIRGLILYNGVYNFDTVGECKFPFWKQLVWGYTGKKDYKKYERLDELSTIKHITPDYPAVFITVGDSDPLEPQTYEFIEKLEDNNVDYDALLWTGTKAKLWHDYIYDQNTEEAVKAYEETLNFIEKHK